MSGARRQNLRGEPIARNKASRGSDPSRADRNFLASPESVRVDILKVSEVSEYKDYCCRNRTYSTYGDLTVNTISKKNGQLFFVRAQQCNQCRTNIRHLII